MAGWASPGLRRVHVRLADALKMDPERPEYHRATLQFSRWVRARAPCMLDVNMEKKESLTSCYAG
jgi:hypothetical protein